jgi:hypothetical protein
MASVVIRTNTDKAEMPTHFSWPLGLHVGSRADTKLGFVTLPFEGIICCQGPHASCSRRGGSFTLACFVPITFQARRPNGQFNRLGQAGNRVKAYSTPPPTE